MSKAVRRPRSGWRRPVAAAGKPKGRVMSAGLVRVHLTVTHVSLRACVCDGQVSSGEDRYFAS